jgi:putative transposase
MGPWARLLWVGKKTGPNPTDRAKKGTKKSLLTDGRGAPVGIAVGGANTPDFKLMRSTVESMPVPRPALADGQLQHLCVDLGYDYDEVRRLAEEFGFTLHLPPRRHQTKKVKRSVRKKARRWVVERTHSWLTRFRRLLVRWEKREDTYLAMLHFALGIITWFHALLPK